MPAMHYTVRWPDGQETCCYSPSLVIQDLLKPQTRYPLTDFMRLVREATAVANERVQAKYGFVCSRANDQLAQLEQSAQPFAQHTHACVTVLEFLPA